MTARISSALAGSAPTGPVTRRCAGTPRRGRRGSGRSRAPTAWVDRWPSGCWRPASRSSTFRPSSLRGSGSSTPAGPQDRRARCALDRVGVRTKGLRVLKVDGDLEALRMLTDRREALTRRRVQTVNRLQALLAELLPGKAKKDITPLQAKAMLATVRPRDIAGKELARNRGRGTGRTGRRRRQDQEGNRRTQGDGAGPRLHADGPARRGPGGRGPRPGRRRQRGPVRRPQPVRLLLID